MVLRQVKAEEEGRGMRDEKRNRGSEDKMVDVCLFFLVDVVNTLSSDIASGVFVVFFYALLS
ncbi:hypothetical protein L249_0137 [Ophiocordyceps polyrhachis-furcata BCC 54312]|uniref:Uncharacterized protein n=1 Tax=Ophiocordyceps polyrhachis-furcata BCC 54312 TaxID=1330021 RepID=A0A367LFB0_9HYPO|nr:hypothetical protein L249_0137 [Ophiocordyceps polyrhachis-furcata BCC 54312]